VYLSTFDDQQQTALCAAFLTDGYGRYPLGDQIDDLSLALYNRFDDQNVPTVQMSPVAHNDYAHGPTPVATGVGPLLGYNTSRLRICHVRMLTADRRVALTRAAPT